MTPTRGFLAGTTMLHNVTYEDLYVNSGGWREVDRLTRQLPAGTSANPGSPPSTTELNR